MNSEFDRAEREQILRGCAIFEGMSRRTAELLCDLSENHFSAGDVIADGDDFSSFRGLGVLLSGKASIYGRDSGTRVLLNRIARSDVFGAATVFFPEQEAVSTVVATTKCRVLFIERNLLETIIENDFAVASAYIAFLSGKIYFLNRKIIAFTAKSADAALAGYLLRAADENGELSVNMSRMASTLGVGRTTLYRAVDALAEAGAIAHDGKLIRILDATLLERKSRD